MPTQKFAPELLAAALEGLQIQKKRLDACISEVKLQLGGLSQTPVVAPEPVRKYKRSAAARKRMAEAQRKRWASLK